MNYHHRLRTLSSISSSTSDVSLPDCFVKVIEALNQMKMAIHLMNKAVFDSFLYAGQLWRPYLPLLGFVWWPCWLWGSCSSLTPSPSPHRSAPSGGDGNPLHAKPAATHMSGWGTYQSPPHSDVTTRPYQGRLAPGCCRGSRFTEYPTHTLLYWEEGFTWEPGDWSHWECLQRHGKMHVFCLLPSCAHKSGSVSAQLHRWNSA